MEQTDDADSANDALKMMQTALRTVALVRVNWFANSLNERAIELANGRTRQRASTVNNNNEFDDDDIFAYGAQQSIYTIDFKHLFTDNAFIKLIYSEDHEKLKNLQVSTFFFDFDSIEPLNGLKYAAQAVWLTKSVTENDVSAPLLSGLEKAFSEESGLTGDAVFRKILDLYDHPKSK